MGKIDIKIQSQKDSVSYDYEIDNPTKNQLARAIGYLEIIKKKLVQELEEEVEKISESEIQK